MDINRRTISTAITAIAIIGTTTAIIATPATADTQGPHNREICPAADTLPICDLAPQPNHSGADGSEVTRRPTPTDNTPISNSATADKSGGDTAPVTLRLGTVETDWAPYAPYVNEFVRAVEETSGGSIDVEVAWEAVPWTPESEGTLATMVSDGDIDLALVPTRGGWDGLGVTSLRALQAPFLVDSLELVNTIVTSELADDMFAGLDPLGIEGLALWPDALRHPIGYERPLLTAADFDGAQLTYPTSETALRLFRALGVEPLAGSTTAAVDVDGVEAALNIAMNLSEFGTFTANITFYPKVNALVANAEVLESLSDDQRDALRTAATDTTAYAVASNRTEADLAAEYCAFGGSVALADAADIAELAELAEPVFAWLEADDATRRIIGEIRELKSTVTVDSANAAAACEPPVDTTPSAGTDAAGVPSELPEGVYRPPANDGGIVTIEIRDGVWTGYFADGTPDCAFTYEVSNGRMNLAFSTDPALACGGVPGDQFLDAAFSFEGDQLCVTDVNSDPGAVAAFTGCVTRIE
jgi:TRAP-type C4-dicarboxylate transport system substrate-binding protein